MYNHNDEDSLHEFFPCNYNVSYTELNITENYEVLRTDNHV